jgi:hypothetical protein
MDKLFLEVFMKKNVLLLLSVITVVLFVSCASTQPMSESAKLFVQETNLSPVVPMRFYTWVKVDNAKRVQPDIFSGLLDFEFDGSADFLLKTSAQDKKIISVWGNQILMQDEGHRQLVFSPFIMAIYALESGQDPIDISFEALRQILADDSYKDREKELIDVFREGIKQYRIGGTTWTSYKNEHFIVEDKTIKIK